MKKSKGWKLFFEPMATNGDEESPSSSTSTTSADLHSRTKICDRGGKEAGGGGYSGRTARSEKRGALIIWRDFEEAVTLGKWSSQPQARIILEHGHRGTAQPGSRETLPIALSSQLLLLQFFHSASVTVYQLCALHERMHILREKHTTFNLSRDAEYVPPYSTAKILMEPLG